MNLVFEWDDRKAVSNIRKHGVSFEEATTVFADPAVRTMHDQLHSDTEDRYISLGESGRRRLLVVVTTERGDKIRLISARRATLRERTRYEEA